MTHSPLCRYSIAVLTVAQVLIIKLLLAPQIGGETPFLLLFTAVMVSAGYGGAGPGLLATTLAALASNYFFLPPTGSFSLSLDEIVKMGVFVLEGLLITSVIVALNAAKEGAESSALKAQRHQEALYKSEERYRLMVEGVKDHAIFMLDPSGEIANWNIGAERIYSNQADEVIGQSFAIFYPEEDQADDLPALGLKIASQEGWFEGTERQVRKDGTSFWADVVITALKDQAGNLQGFSRVTRDVTERKQLEDALHQRAETLEQVNRIKDEFLATLSHELRTPLNSVLGWAQLLRTRKLNEAKITSGLETIERNAKLQVQLIEDLLDASSIIKGKLRLELRSIDLVSVIEAIEAAIATVRPAVEAKAINLSFSISGVELRHPVLEQETIKSDKQLEVPSCAEDVLKTQPKIQSESCIMADPDRLQQVVWNLLSNAVKFTPDRGHVKLQLEQVNQSGHEQVAIEEHMATQGHGDVGKASLLALSPHPTSISTPYVQITISDTGQGISPDFLPYVFNRFSQANSTSTRLHNGMGLGLAIARHLVELHGGTICADSRGEGQGATFIVRLPH